MMSQVVRNLRTGLYSECLQCSEQTIYNIAVERYRVGVGVAKLFGSLVDDNDFCGGWWYQHDQIDQEFDELWVCER